jgi:hypothetical protein
LIVNALIVVESFASTASFSTGVRQLRQVYDPSDMQNVLFQVLLAAPVCVAILWRNHRQERPAH